MTHQRLPWRRRRPFCRDLGYVASLPCKDGSGWWVVVYDCRTLGVEDLPGRRWAISFVLAGAATKTARGAGWFSSEVKAREAMKNLASAWTSAELKQWELFYQGLP